MLKGYNSDIQFKGQSFHIQTEDWGKENPYFVTRVFKNGAVLKTYKVSYLELLNKLSATSQLQDYLKRQHEQVIDLVMENKLI